MRSKFYESFAWGGSKALSNERKHGISFELAVTVFEDPLAGITRDVAFGGDEERWSAVGIAENDVLVVVVCTIDDSDHRSNVRIVSARRATVRERRQYEGGESAVREPAMMNVYAKHGPVTANDPDMRVEYDFSDAIRGKFANARLPIYIENRTLGYFHGQAIATGKSSEDLINEVLRQHVSATGYVPPVFAERR